MLVLLRTAAASGQTLPSSPGNEAAVSLSGAFGLAYATAALLVAGALIVADHRNGVRNALWVIIGSVILFFGSQIIRMIHG